MRIAPPVSSPLPLSGEGKAVLSLIRRFATRSPAKREKKNQKTITFLSAAPEREDATASLIRSSGYRPEINSSSFRRPSR